MKYNELLNQPDCFIEIENNKKQKRNDMKFVKIRNKVEI